MATFNISSAFNVDYGQWSGDTSAEALLALHREAGYDENQVWLEDGELQFKNEEYRRLIGDTSDWQIERVLIDCKRAPARKRVGAFAV